MDVSRADDNRMTEACVAPLVEARDLTVRYGPIEAVKGIELAVRPGEVLGLLGGNGAGKTSTLKAIAGVNPPTSGRLLVAGCDMAQPNEAETARHRLGYTPDVGGLIRQSTPREHAILALSCRSRLDDLPYALSLMDEFGLTDVLDRDTAGFSHGMSRRLSVALAALTATHVLALDEPFDGVDPLGVTATQEVIRRARNAGVAVLVSTHLLGLLVEVCDSIAVMNGGRIVEVGVADRFTGRDGENQYKQLLQAGTA